MVMQAQELLYGSFGGSKYMLMGPTNAGKTTFVSKLVHPNATILMSQMIGKGNCTLTPKTFVLSEAPELVHVIRLCAKPNPQPMNRKDYDEVIMETFGALAKQAAKENVKHVETPKELLTKGFIKGDNHVSFLGLLQGEAEKWIGETSAIIDQVGREELRSIYDIARARVEDPESAKAKSKSADIDFKLSEVFREYLDGSFPHLSGKEIGLRLAHQYNHINNLFYDLATYFFEGSEKTCDGYLTHTFPLVDTMDEALQEKKNAFFSDNSNEHKISMEVLYEELVVYVGINPGIVKLLGLDGEKFRNRNGVIEFGLIDTMGAFHRYGDKGETKQYLANLSREHEYDGIILLIPLILEANEKKFVQLSSDFFRQFPYDLDVVMISNKVDRFIDQFKKEWKSKHVSLDPFADNADLQDQPIDMMALKEQLISSMNLIQKELTDTVEEQGNGRVHILDHLATSFVEPRIDTMGLDQLSQLPQTVLQMMRLFARAKKSVDKISVEFNDAYGADIGIAIDSVALNQGITHILKPSMFDNIYSNCRDNAGKIPHGNSFNALPSRLIVAEGYKVHLSDRFVRVHSFEITFPGTIRNFLQNIEKEILSVMRDCIVFHGVRNLTTEIKDTLLSRLATRLSIRNIAANLVYAQTFRPVMKLPYYSFGSKFQSYIGNVKCKLTQPQQCQAYTEAIVQEVRRAFKATLDSDVVYRR